MDTPSLLVALLMGLLVLVAVRHRLRRVAQEEGRRLLFDEAGRLVSIGEDAAFEPLRFLGEGQQTTRAIALQAGEYKLVHRFPDDIKVMVETIDTASGDREMILLQSGLGAVALTVRAGGHFMLHITPQPGEDTDEDEESAWEIILSRLALPSGQ